MRKLSSGKCSGIKRPFKLEEVWRIRTRLEYVATITMGDLATIRFAPLT